MGNKSSSNTTVSNDKTPVQPKVQTPSYSEFYLSPTIESVILDFPSRDAFLEKYMIASTQLRHDSWGPKPPTFPLAQIPVGIHPVEWQRARVVEVAKKYIGLPYKHHHVPTWYGPEGQGIDCSNFTSWIYNYGLGIRFTSHCQKQAESDRAPGRKLKEGEKLEPGDLLFIEKKRQKCHFTCCDLYWRQ